MASPSPKIITDDAGTRHVVDEGGVRHLTEESPNWWSCALDAGDEASWRDFARVVLEAFNPGQDVADRGGN